MSEHGAPSTTPPVIPGTHEGSLQPTGSAPAGDGATIAAATSSPAVATTGIRTYDTVARLNPAASSRPTRWDIVRQKTEEVAQ
ncbi:hypothetical protein GCM10009632_03190 [Mycolicibacterium alvei]|uniref:Uncharacterized protein n=1 Tax=Mycolicibacterium alvei TaxID=67081 RepID=A0A6N4UTP7_9MYCO|nr:hypothetical protein MALV_29030 [Mycolicibacterium alvei]